MKLNPTRPPARLTAPPIPRCRVLLTLLGLLSLALPSLVTRASAQIASYRVLHTFGEGDGAKPMAPLLFGMDGNLYGTASAGGANGTGAIFELTPGGPEIVLHSFAALSNGTNSDGATPIAALIQDGAGNFYGTTEYGGANGYGTVFELTAAGTFTTLYTFSGGDGAYPDGALLFDIHGDLYGTTSQGGASGAGTIFVLQSDPGGPDFHSLYSFNGTSDGKNPIAGLIQAKDGNFYGTAENGGTSGDGTAIGKGTVFEFTYRGTFTTLYTFSSNDVAGNPTAPLIQANDGNFYCATKVSASNTSNGTAIFQLTPAGAETLIQYFGSNTAESSCGSLIQGSDGLLYGAVPSASPDGGLVYRIPTPPAENNPQTPYVFTALDSSGKNADGAVPVAALIEGEDGNFYGTTSAGGTGGEGTIFEISLAPFAITSAPTATAEVGHAFSYQITASDSPSSYSVTGLSDGLIFNDETGRISGTPAATGTLHLTVYASNDVGSCSQALTVRVQASSGTLQFTAAADSVKETVGSVTVQVSRTGGSAGAVAVTCGTSSGTAKSGTDYNGLSKTLSWAAGDTTDKSFTVSLKDVGLSDGSTRSFGVVLSAPTGGASLGSRAKATVTITENDPTQGELEFAAASESVSESAGKLTVFVNRTGGSTGAVSVTCGTSSGTAKSGTDYLGTSKTLSWAAGDTAAKSFSVTIINRGASGGNGLQFSLKLSSPTGGAILASPSTATVTIK